MVCTVNNLLRTLGVLTVLWALSLPAAHAGALGADVNADVDAFGHSQMDRGGLEEFARHSTVYALPLFNLPDHDHARYWDSLVEQYQSSQIDFIAVWLKGNNQPATFGNCVTALEKRGLTHRVKIMAFDDNPASWTALWNFDHGSGYGYKVPFDVSKEEAEGCDDFSGAASLPGKPNFFRNGPIAIEDTIDTYGGYDVCNGRVGETLRWQEVPIQGKVHLLVRVATPAAKGRLHFVIDGAVHPSVRLPKTGGPQRWATVDIGAYRFAPHSYHTVSLVWDTPGVSVNWWQVQTGK